MDKNIAAFLRNDTKTVKIRFFSTMKEMTTSFELGNNARIDLTDPYAGLKLSNKAYTYVTNLDLAVNDLVMVWANGIPNTVLVVAVHDDLCIEPDEEIEYKWIAARIDLSEYKKNMEKNKELTQTIGVAYKQNLRRNFQQILLNGLSEEKRLQLNSILEK